MQTRRLFKVGRDTKHVYIDRLSNYRGIMYYLVFEKPQYKIYTLNNKRN